MHKNNKPVKKLNSTGRRNCVRILWNMRTSLVAQVVCFKTLISRPQLWSRNNSSYFILVRNYFSLKNYVTSEGAISHNVLYYQQLSIALYQVKFFMITIIFSNYQQCPMPLNSLKLHFVVNYAYDNAS